MSIGNHDGADRHFDGVLDEIRLSSSARSSDWIAAEYLATTDSFVVFANSQFAGVINNDVDADGDPLSSTTLTGPSNETAFALTPATGNFDYSPAAGFSGIDAFTYTLSDGVSSATGVASLVVSSPTINANAGGNYTVAEGSNLLLDGSSSTGGDGSALTYRWDLNNDADFSDAIGTAPTLTWSALQALGVNDDGVYVIGVEATDGTDFAYDYTTLYVTNTAPSVTVTGAATVNAGDDYTITLGVSDPGNDPVTNWLIDWGDGNLETLAGTVTTATHQYDDAGFTRDIVVSAVQTDGTFLSTEILVAGEGSDNITRFSNVGDLVPPAFADTGELTNHGFMTIGPDGRLYASGDSNNVVVYDANTGAFAEEFVASNEGILRAEGIAFGADGNLYVASANSNQILRFNGTTSELIDVFVPAAATLSNPQGIAFGPDGYLYVADFNNDRIMRFDAATGSRIEANGFVLANAGGVDQSNRHCVRRRWLPLRF